jgi:hypothetical protein
MSCPRSMVHSDRPGLVAAKQRNYLGGPEDQRTRGSECSWLRFMNRMHLEHGFDFQDQRFIDDHFDLIVFIDCSSLSFCPKTYRLTPGCWVGPGNDSTAWAHLCASVFIPFLSASKFLLWANRRRLVIERILTQIRKG